MQVNRATFPATFPHFAELLATCEFYAIDEEMTGISVSELPESITDSPSASYEAKRAAASRYSVMQCGVCLFHRAEPDGETSRPRYVARPFNFLMFPHAVQDSNSRRGEEAGAVLAKDVVVNPSTFAFLQRHGMDFQRWVTEGIPFCDRHAEAAYRASQSTGTVVSEAGELAKIRAWLVDADKAWVEAAEASARACLGAQAETPNSSRTVTLTDGAPSRAAREYFKAYLAEAMPTVSVSYRRVPSSSPPSYMAVLTAVSEVERARRAAQSALLARRDALDALGVRHVFSALAASGKPCVGHNCFADWLFLLSALDGPLPATLPLFKDRLHALFPALYDTKYLSSRVDLFPPDRFASTHLGGLFAEYTASAAAGSAAGGVGSQHVDVTLPLGFLSYDTLSLTSGRGLAHEAGYDALMTGTVFLNMLREAGLTLLETSSSVVNKLALFRSLYALDVSAATATDPFLPGAAFLLTHRRGADGGVTSTHVEACLASEAAWAARHGRVHPLLDAERRNSSSVVSFPAAGATMPTAEALQGLLARHVTHVEPIARCADTQAAPCAASLSRFAFPSSASSSSSGSGGTGLLRGTAPRLCMKRLFLRHC